MGRVNHVPLVPVLMELTVCHGRPSGSQVRAGEQQGTWRHQASIRTLARPCPGSRSSHQSCSLSGQPLLWASHASHLHGLEKVWFLNLLNQMRLDVKSRSVDS